MTEATDDHPASLIEVPSGYAEGLAELKSRIHQAQHSATRAVNRELVWLYWRIGRDILERQAEQGWGAKVIDRLAHDLRTAFPAMKGFSRANLMYMRAFAEAWPDAAIVQQAVGQLPWGHNLVLLTRLKHSDQRLAYAQRALVHGWSRAMLEIHIETRLLEREGKAVTNFAERLPAPGTDLARQSLKDPYRFDFKVVAEYVLRDSTQPMGVAEYRLIESLPAELQTSLPSIEQIERELEGRDEAG